MTRTIDLNADMGEGYGPWAMGDDAGMMPFIDIANVACGFHASDFDHMRATVRLAISGGCCWALGCWAGSPHFPPSALNWFC